MFVSERVPYYFSMKTVKGRCGHIIIIITNLFMVQSRVVYYIRNFGELTFRLMIYIQAAKYHPIMHETLSSYITQ